MGQDGALIPQWPEKWPGQRASDGLRAAVARLPEPRVRLVPFGKHCAPDVCDSIETTGEACVVGSVWSCMPDIERAPWVALEGGT